MSAARELSKALGEARKPHTTCADAAREVPIVAQITLFLRIPTKTAVNAWMTTWVQSSWRRTAHAPVEPKTCVQGNDML